MLRSSSEASLMMLEIFHFFVKKQIVNYECMREKTYSITFFTDGLRFSMSTHAGPLTFIPISEH